MAADKAGSAVYKPGWHAGTPWDIGWARGNCRQTRRCRNAARKAREPPRAGDPRPAIAGRTVDCRTVATAAQRRWSPPLANRPARAGRHSHRQRRSEEHTSELQSLMRSSYAVFCLKKQTQKRRVHEKKPGTNTKQ